MKIQQFEDSNLAHFSYAILSEGKIAIVDPSRDPQPYYDFAKENNAKIEYVIETHPHADFVSSHLEISKETGAKILASKLTGASYPHETFDEGEIVNLGGVRLKAWNTPGHSADSITMILEAENGKDYAAFTGDTLFIGDCGRPDLRENAGNIQQKREEQSKDMYHSLHRFHDLQDDVIVYPAHGAGSLCGKGLEKANSSTIGKEKRTNWSLQSMSEEVFVKSLMEGQPMIPHYFGYDVDVNRQGADNYLPSIKDVKFLDTIDSLEKYEALNANYLIIDTRPEELFKKGHLKNAINIQEGNSFETWLGSIVKPNQQFYLIGESKAVLENLIERSAKIGYEKFIAAAFEINYFNSTDEKLNLENFNNNQEDYTIIDIRSEAEAADKIFKNAINIPLHKMEDQVADLKTTKPVVIHCAGGYRSAAGSSLLKKLRPDLEVLDLSVAIENFKTII